MPRTCSLVLLGLVHSAVATNWWTYGFYDQSSSTCATGKESAAIKTKNWQQAQVGECMKHSAAGFTWSMKVDSCTPGQDIVIKEYLGDSCAGTGTPKAGVTYTDGGCVLVDGTRRKATCSTSEQQIEYGNRVSYYNYLVDSNCGTENSGFKTPTQTVDIGTCMKHEVPSLSTKFSMKIDYCVPGQRIVIKEFANKNCQGSGTPRHELYYKNGQCVTVDGRQAKATCLLAGDDIPDIISGAPPACVVSLIVAGLMFLAGSA